MSHYTKVLRQRVVHALTHLLTTERHTWARELASILREIADELDELDPPQDVAAPPGEPGSKGGSTLDG
jgi:hypothetical protein